MRANPSHQPVLPREVLRFLLDAGVNLLLDATVGAGGHAASFLEAKDEGRVVGLDRDPEMLEVAARRLAPYGDRVTLKARSFGELDAALAELSISQVDGALFDLGVNSLQFERPDRGFSFSTPGPLDMRFDRTTGETAADLVNRLPEPELADLIYRYGDEHRARRIAREIVRERPIRDTQRLAAVVAVAIGSAGGRIHPATRTFQALRIAVNRELAEVERGIPAAVERLRPGGVLAVISFHSGEDRVVKGLFREEARRDRARIETKKPLRAGPDEVRTNPRARSARLRVLSRTGAEA